MVMVMVMEMEMEMEMEMDGWIEIASETQKEECTPFWGGERRMKLILKSGWTWIKGPRRTSTSSSTRSGSSERREESVVRPTATGEKVMNE